MASWFLKYIIVHDLQTRERFYFLCQDWLAVEKSDGQIERELFVSCGPQKKEIKFLIQKQTHFKMIDSHLWYSVFARPVHSSFTRLDRVTCCFVLLFISMLIDIMYYGTATSLNSQRGIHVGPFSVTIEQVPILLNVLFRITKN